MQIKRTVATVGGLTAAVLSIGLLTGCTAGADTPSSEPEAPKPSATAPAAEDTAEVTKPGVGTPVTDGNIKFVVNSVTYSDAPMEDGNYGPLAPKGQFAIVNVSATAQAEIGMYLGQVTITTAQVHGKVTPDVGANMYAGALTADYIHKGQTLTGNVVFDIAKGDTVETVLVQETAMSAGVTVTVK